MDAVVEHITERQDRTAELRGQLAEIGRKLDWICEEVESQRRLRLSLEDLEADAAHVAREAFRDLADEMGAFERKGYFRFARQAAALADTLIATHSSADLDQARASIPQLVGFIRELTRPAVLEALEAIVYGFGQVQAVEKADVSLVQLIREANSPDARRGFDILVRFLKVVGARSAKESRREA